MSKEVLELAKRLINQESITPNDNGCQEILKKYLQEMGFVIEDVSSGKVKNFWARRGAEGPLLAFSGHTDVVPSGPLEKWVSPPFSATVRENNLFGRGAADMKGALAAMIIACQQFINQYPEHKGSIGFMITSDEEGEGVDGTIRLVEYIQKQAIKLDWCLIGEASSQDVLGDAIKVGRRGSLHGFLQVIGKQGHIAYPHLADNPIHRSFKVLDELTRVTWDNGDEFFSPTSFQIYNIQADTGASNVIPGALTARFNFRFSPASPSENLKQRVQKILDEHDLKYKIDWMIGGQPFFSPPGKLAEACKQSILKICARETKPNTIGGTSDGRFIARLGCEIVELGVVNQTIHQINEHVPVDDLIQLSLIYNEILKTLLSS